ncbi:MAG TPA: ABC transporter substrate-binding protein, partial [Dehalococcoidia bacterium]|nr:ABC transporter substrate-binding protein [Dehalococcoidia bacterium]
ITGIETPDDSTVVIQVKRPYASLLVNLAQGWMAIYDKEWIEAKGNNIPEKEVIGTGPFLVKKYTRGTEVTREKNPNYWNKGLPYLDGIKHLIVPDQNTRLAAFRTGQVHIFAPKDSDFKKLQQELGDKVNFERGGAGLSPGTLYPNSTRKPFDNPKVREAIYLTANRWDAIQVLDQGDGFVGGYMRPGGSWSLSEEEILKFPGYGKDKTKDIERAKQLLAEAGFPSGFDAVVKTRQSQGYIDGSVFAIDQLKKIGINATMKPYETAQAYDAANNADYDLLYWGHGFALDDPDAVYNEFYLCNAPRNWSRLCSPQVDELFLKQSQEMDPAKRKEMMLQLERLAVPLASKIVFKWAGKRSAHWSFVKGYTAHTSSYNNIRFDSVWLDK